MNLIIINKMKTLIFASHNKNKALEIRALLPEDLQLKTLNDLNLKEEIPETGRTLEENALLKAQYIYRNFGEACFADDTGLEVDSLNGEPGVYSARYAGLQKSSEDNMNKLLKELISKENRNARFRTAIAYINEKGEEFLFDGIVEGRIAKERMGEKGFGYDPIFIPEDGHLSFAQMSAAQKNEISHRARSLRHFLDFLESQKN